MHKGRLEAFSDAVIAIVMTIMVLEVKVPHGSGLEDLLPLWPIVSSYVLSFVYLGIYWNNHHHLLQAVRHVDGRILWANMHLLFWLSLVPAVTHWMGETHFAPWPVAVYGAVMALAGVAYFVLTRVLIARHGQDAPLAQAVGGEVKGQLSVALYVAAMPLAFVATGISCAIYVGVAVWWLVPDRRIERVLSSGGATRGAA